MKVQLLWFDDLPAYKSEFLPRFPGVLLVLDGIGVLVWFLQACYCRTTARSRTPDSP